MRQSEIPMTAARPSDLKLNNRAQILELFKSGDVFSIAEIAQRVGISRQTVMKSIQFFLSRDIISSEGKMASGRMGGKRAELFSLNARRYLFNLLISPDSLHVSMFNCRCEVIDSCVCEDIAGMAADDISAMAGAACHRLMAAHGISGESVRGVCVTTAGIVAISTNRVKYNVMFPGWGKDISFAEKLAPYFDAGTLFVTENVSRVCGAALQRNEVCRRGIVISVSSVWGGVGACLITEERIRRGRDFLIGEIGHMMLNPLDREVCNCGWRGCFERQVSVERLRSLIQADPEALAASCFAGRPVGEISIRDVFAASAAGDVLGRKLSGYAAGYFSSALRNMMLMSDPDCVILQGDYAWADDAFLETVRRELGIFKYYGCSSERGRPFEIRTDRRPIEELATIGAYTLLIERLYRDEAALA